MEEDKKKLKPKIKKQIISKLNEKPIEFDFRNELKFEDKASFNPYLELHYTKKTEMGCFFGNQAKKKTSSLGLNSLKEFQLGKFYIMPENDVVYVRDYEFQEENRRAVRYHYTVRLGPKKTDEKEMDIFIAIDWAIDGKSKAVRFDLFFIMKEEGDSLLDERYTQLAIDMTNYIMEQTNHKSVCKNCIHRFAYQMNNECGKIYEKEL